MSEPYALPETPLSIPEFPIPTATPPVKKFRVPPLLMTGLILGAIVGYAVFFRVAYDKTHPTPIPPNREAPVSYAQPSVTPQKHLKLQTKSADTWEDIYDFQLSDDPALIRTGNYLVYGTQGYGSAAELRVIDLTTGKISTPFHDDNEMLYIGLLRIIDGTLFFGTGGYMQSGGTYWMSLPPTGKPVKMLTSANSRIVEEWGHTWITSGEGDGCGGGGSHYLFDSKAKTAVHIADSAYGCMEGEELMGVDKEDRILVATHRQPTELSNDEFGDFAEYTEIKTAPLSDPQNFSTILKAGMPKNIAYVVYLEKSNAFYMGSKDITYFYDLDRSKLSEISGIPNDWRHTTWFTEPSSGLLCLWRTPPSSDALLKLRIDLSESSVNPDTSPCTLSESDSLRFNVTRQSEDKIDSLIKTLDLPENYRLIRE